MKLVVVDKQCTARNGSNDQEQENFVVLSLWGFGFSSAIVLIKVNSLLFHSSWEVVECMASTRSIHSIDLARESIQRLNLIILCSSYCLWQLWSLDKDTKVIWEIRRSSYSWRCYRYRSCPFLVDNVCLSLDLTATKSDIWTFSVIDDRYFS